MAQVSTPSDGRIKDIQKILSPEKSLSKLLSLQGVHYTYTEEGYPEGPHLGFLAEEVKKVIPEIVGKDGEDEILSIRYDELLPLVVEGMKKFREENTQLAQENTQLAEQNTQLVQEMARFKEEHDRQYTQLKEMVEKLQDRVSVDL